MVRKKHEYFPELEMRVYSLFHDTSHEIFFLIPFMVIRKPITKKSLWSLVIFSHIYILYHSCVLFMYSVFCISLSCFPMRKHA